MQFNSIKLQAGWLPSFCLEVEKCQYGIISGIRLVGELAASKEDKSDLFAKFPATSVKAGANIKVISMLGHFPRTRNY